MKRNYTSPTQYKSGKPRIPVLYTNRKKFPSDLSDNYKMILQIYCLNKKEACTKKEIKYEKLPLGATDKNISKSSFSILTLVTSFFTSNLNLFKKVRQEISVVTE